MRCAAFPALCAAVLAALAGAPAARAAVKITQHVYGDAGQPLLVANEQPDGSKATPSWRICAPGCGAVVSTDQALEPGPVAPGTTFEASTTVGDVTTTDRSRVWTGPLASTAPPTLDVLGGALRPGVTLTARAGAWSGGWADNGDFSQLGLRACRTPQGGDCRALTSWKGGSRHPETTVLGGPYVGWYVGAVESRLSGESASTLELIPDPDPSRLSPLPAPAPGATLAAGPLVGPVAATPAGAAPPVVVRAKVRLRKTARRDGRQLFLGIVRCTTPCSFRVRVRQGRRVRTWRAMTSPATQAPIVIAASRLPGPGRLRVTVEVAGGRATAGWVRRR